MIETQHIVVAMKPLDGNYAENALKHGVAGLNIEETRIAIQEGDTKQETAGKRTIKLGIQECGCSYQKGTGAIFTNIGRWPSNVILSHLPGCRYLGTKKIAGDKATGLTQTKARSWKNASVAGINRTGYAGEDGKETVEEWECEEGCPILSFQETDNKGTSARFFKQVKEL